MNENIRIDNRTVRWRHGSRWKNALSHEYRNNNGRNSQFTRFSFIDFIDEEIFQVNGKIGLWQIFRLSTFVLSGEKRHYQSHWMRNFRFLVFVCWFSFSEQYGCSSNVLAAIIRGSSDKLPCIENREGFAVHSLTWPQVSPISSWLVISNTHEKVSYFGVFVF